MTTDDDSCLLKTQLMYTTLAKRKCCDACVQPHDLTGNLAKIHTAIRLYDEGIYAREILREQVPGKAVDTDHRWGVWNCFREGHSGLSSNDLNMSRTACHSGKKVCTHIPRCLNNPGHVLENGVWRQRKGSEKPTVVPPRQWAKVLWSQKSFSISQPLLLSFLTSLVIAEHMAIKNFGAFDVDVHLPGNTSELPKLLWTLTAIS